MLGAISTLSVVLALLSLAAAGVAIGWLSKVSKHVSDLGMRILESEDIDKIIKASDKTITFESRMTACEEKADGSQKQLAEHDTKLNGLTSNGAAVAQVVDRHSADLATASEKMASLESRCDSFENFESRFEGFKNNVNEKLNQLPEHETKINELATKLESVEETVNKNGSDLAQDSGSIRTLKEEIESLREFQTATEKARSLILAAFGDMQTSIPREDSPEVVPEAVEPAETSEEPEHSLIMAPEAPESGATSREPEEGQEETDNQHSFGTYN